MTETRFESNKMIANIVSTVWQFFDEFCRPGKGFFFFFKSKNFFPTFRTKNRFANTHSAASHMQTYFLQQTDLRRFFEAIPSSMFTYTAIKMSKKSSELNLLSDFYCMPAINFKPTKEANNAYDLTSLRFKLDNGSLSWAWSGLVSLRLR